MNDDDDVSWLEVETAIKKMKSNKSAGIDEFSVDMIKSLGPIGVQWVYRVVKAIWRENCVPDDWKRGIIIPFFKKGDKKKCPNYRGITLLSHGLKLYESVLAEKIRKKIEPYLEEEQHGFRPNRSTIDLIFAIRMLFEKFWEKNKPIIAVFLDIEKAYDSIPRHLIWEVLLKKGVPEGIVARVKQLYRDTKSCIQIQASRSDWFETRSGVQQGSCLSPLLFISIMDDIIKSVKERDQICNAMAFADDVMIWGKNVKEVQQQLNSWKEEFDRFGLKISQSKTVCLVMSREIEAVKLKIGHQEIENVQQFKYLGSVVTSDNRLTQETSSRIKAAANFYSSVRHLLWDKSFPQAAKVSLYKMYLIPILTYGLEAATLTRRDNSRIQAMEMKFDRASKKPDWIKSPMNLSVFIWD